MPSFLPVFQLRTVLLVSVIFTLSACGEGWEPVGYSGFPYSNSRTAGHGIAYVRTNMLPSRGAILESAKARKAKTMEEAPKAEMAEDAGMTESEGVLKTLDKAFNKALRK